MTTRCLDITRLVSRIGRGPLTGIDRVERAYLRALLSRDDPLVLLAAVGGRFLMLDRSAGVMLDRRLDAPQDWGPMDLRALIGRESPALRRRAESDLRRAAIDAAGRRGLAALLARHLGGDGRYLNVGHSNLGVPLFDALARLPWIQVTVFIHDTIPLDHPEWQRPGMAAGFARRLGRVGARADLVIYNSAVTRHRAEAQFRRRGRVPPGVVAHLGHDPVPPGDPPALRPGHPYFVTLGTIEPRKNHALLLDAWETLCRDMEPEAVPHLHIVGRRGWANAAVFARLDTAPFMGRQVFEHGAFEDAAVAALLRGARALLFPSRDEGFGLPLVEAAAAGVPAICAPLPAFREVMGGYPLYLDPDDPYLWASCVRTRAADPTTAPGGGAGPVVPSWRQHFGRVLDLT